MYMSTMYYSMWRNVHESAIKSTLFNSEKLNFKQSTPVFMSVHVCRWREKMKDGAATQGISVFI